EQYADTISWIRQLPVWHAEDARAASTRRSEAGDHAQRRGLAGPVRSEEPGYRPGLAANRHAGYRRLAAVVLGEVVGFDHAGSVGLRGALGYGRGSTRHRIFGRSLHRRWSDGARGWLAYPSVQWRTPLRTTRSYRAGSARCCPGRSSPRPRGPAMSR